MCTAERHDAAIFGTTELWGVYRCRRSPGFGEITISEGMAVSERHSTVDHLPCKSAGRCYGTHFSMDKQTRCKGDFFLRLLQSLWPVSSPFGIQTPSHFTELGRWQNSWRGSLSETNSLVSANWCLPSPSPVSSFGTVHFPFSSFHLSPVFAQIRSSLPALLSFFQTLLNAVLMMPFECILIFLK